MASNGYRLPLPLTVTKVTSIFLSLTAGPKTRKSCHAASNGIQMVSHPSDHRIVEFRVSAAGGEALYIRRTPFMGEQDMLNHLSESQNLKVQAGPAPCRRPLPTSSMRFLSLHPFSSLTK